MTTKEKIDQAVDGIKSELEVREKELLSANELVKRSASARARSTTSKC